jgi:hypothetical protein
VESSPSQTPVAAQPESGDPQSGGGGLGIWTVVMLIGLAVVLAGLGLWGFVSLRR